MKTRTWLGCACLLLAACGGGGNTLRIDFLAPLMNADVPQGAVVDVAAQSDAGTPELFADADGDLSTVADQIALDGPWDTTGAPLATYRILARVGDVVRAAPGTVRVNGAPAPRIDSPAVTRLALDTASGPRLDVAFDAGDPEGEASAAFFLDVDGDFATLGDRTPLGTLAAGSVGGLLDVGAVPPGDYAVGARFDDGVNSAVEVRAPGALRVLPHAATALGVGTLGRLAVLRDGRMVVAGAFHGTSVWDAGEADEVTLETSANAGDDDVALACLAPDGTRRWLRQIGAGGIESLAGLVALGDGAFVVAGRYEQEVSFGDEPGDVLSGGPVGGAQDAFLACYEADGRVRWLRRLHSSNFLYLETVRLAADGGLYVSGRFRNNLTVAEGTPRAIAYVSPVIESETAFILRCDAQGLPLWARYASCSSSVVFRCAAAPDGGCAVGVEWRGEMEVRGETPAVQFTATGSSRQTLLLRLSSDGTLLWARDNGQGGDQTMGSLFVYPDGSLLARGSILGTATYGAGTPGETTVDAPGLRTNLRMRYAADGSLQWLRRDDRGSHVPRPGGPFLVFDTLVDVGAQVYQLTMQTRAADGDVLSTRVLGADAVRLLSLARQRDGAMVVMGEVLRASTIGADSALSTDLAPPGRYFFMRIGEDGSY